MFDWLLDDIANGLRVISPAGNAEPQNVSTFNANDVYSFKLIDITGKIIRHGSGNVNYNDITPGIYIAKVYRNGELLNTFKKSITR